MVVHAIESEGVADSRDAPLASALRSYITWQQQLSAKLSRTTELCKFWQCHAQRKAEEAAENASWRERAHRILNSQTDLESRYEARLDERNRLLDEADQFARRQRQEIDHLIQENNRLRQSYEALRARDLARSESPVRPAEKLVRDIEALRRQLAHQKLEASSARAAFRGAQEELGYLRGKVEDYEVRLGNHPRTETSSRRNSRAETSARKDSSRRR